ncbi:PREDICTED: carbohydrate sulfotransferase 15-like [Branchiostoma belcheri]|uniref:Sulfotransferase n=1 Tax=Branchiostoma belcheri TaxID=7741 RepID=A0A6P4YDA1_BRABE|nr:PREDICTED: carbohydrate sulfotransferase 15-like [Branchiostoma belcheri]
MSMLYWQRPTSRLFLGTALLGGACVLTLLSLYGYRYGDAWPFLDELSVPRKVSNSWSQSKVGSGNEMANPNTFGLGEKTQQVATLAGFNMTKELRRLHSGVFSALPRKFLPDYKNPCWFEEVNKKDVKPKERWQKRVLHNGTRHFLFRCLPYFYIIGMPKCGTTDLYHRISKHPEVVHGQKEPHWWAKARIHNLERYLKLFEEAAWAIRSRKTKSLTSAGQEIDYHGAITGDGSPSTIWCNGYWRDQQWDTPNNEPPILLANLLHAVQPHAKFILTLRNPTDRLYSEYLFFSGGFRYNKSLTDFHKRVNLAIGIFTNCLRNNSVRSCAYEPNLPATRTVRLRLGLYEVYLRDWLSIFSRDQILVQRLEDYSKDLRTTMTEVFKFLDLGPVKEKAEQDAIFTSNTQRSQTKSYDKIGQMLPKTRKVLNKFYKPYNQRLAALLNNTDFLWQ